MYAHEILGGPYDSPPVGETISWYPEKNGWMAVKMLSEPCPVCNQAFGQPTPGEVIDD